MQCIRDLHLEDWFILSFYFLCVCLILGAARQVFIDKDDNQYTGYGREGHEWVLRSTSLEETHGEGGWGRCVPCSIEVYVDDELIEIQEARCDYVCSVTPDLDCDGDVDLQDYAILQRRMNEGPG